jgi:hypothetical protein
MPVTIIALEAAWSKSPVVTGLLRRLSSDRGTRLPDLDDQRQSAASPRIGVCAAYMGASRGINHEQRTRPQRSRQQRRQCKRPQRSRQQLRHHTCVTLLLSSSMTAAGSGAMGAALAALEAAARINPATPTARMVRIIASIPFLGVENLGPQSHERYSARRRPSEIERRLGAQRLSAECEPFAHAGRPSCNSDRSKSSAFRRQSKLT